MAFEQWRSREKVIRLWNEEVSNARKFQDSRSAQARKIDTEAKGLYQTRMRKLTADLEAAEDLARRVADLRQRSGKHHEDEAEVNEWLEQKIVEAEREVEGAEDELLGIIDEAKAGAVAITRRQRVAQSRAVAKAMAADKNALPKRDLSEVEQEIAQMKRQREDAKASNDQARLEELAPRLTLLKRKVQEGFVIDSKCTPSAGAALYRVIESP